MAATIIDSLILGDIFSTPEMRQIWSDENRIQKYLDFEAALAKVQGQLGIIPTEAAEEIVSHCKIEEIDFPVLKKRTEEIGYPVLGVVSQLNKLCRDGLGSIAIGGPPPKTSPTRRRSYK